MPAQNNRQEKELQMIATTAGAVVVVCVLVALVVFWPTETPTTRLVKLLRAWRKR